MKTLNEAEIARLTLLTQQLRAAIAAERDRRGYAKARRDNE
jgi:hypothetical protein